MGTGGVHAITDLFLIQAPPLKMDFGSAHTAVVCSGRCNLVKWLPTRASMTATDALSRSAATAA